MSVTISGVEPGSPAKKAGFAAGDVLLRIDGHEIADVLDYRFYMTAKRLVCEGTAGSGEPFWREVRKAEYGELGLLFDTYLMDRQKSCKNKCVFCFIDQLPKGLRESLYFKDDDSRLGFLFGNYITLTNLEERDVNRILAMHISPVNVSVHTMNPALRVSMMKNPHAGEALRHIPELVSGGIQVNAQLVLCPGLNDGAELTYSLERLTALSPGVQSVAVVPVGLTRYRGGLPPLRLFTGEEAAAVIEQVGRFGDRMLERHGTRVCYAADELYLAAGRPIPDAAFYGDFDQLENGVGLLALQEDEFTDALEQTEPFTANRSVAIATGTAAAPFLQKLAERAEAKFPGLHVEVFPIVNDFFGHTITVAGLVTGGDIARQLAVELRAPSRFDELLIPSAMLRHEGDLFLDGMSVSGLEEKLGVPVIVLPRDGYQLLDAMLYNRE